MKSSNSEILILVLSKEYTYIYTAYIQYTYSTVGALSPKTKKNSGLRP